MLKNSKNSLQFKLIITFKKALFSFWHSYWYLL